jgi:hypothetical protein
MESEPRPYEPEETSFARLGRQWHALWRLVLPTREERRYERLLKEDPSFDRDFYLASNPRLNRLYRHFPERHYVQRGEAAGLCPNPGFAPLAYRLHNPDLDRPDLRPLAHWIATGRDEARATLEALDGPPPVPEMPVLGPGDRPSPQARVAVVLHLHYPDLWPEFAAALAEQGFDFDLYVTSSAAPEAVEDLARAVRTDVPNARIWAVPNRGRDLLPFVHLVGSGLFEGYAAVLKLHGKRSPHRADGAQWRRALVAGVLGAPERVARRLDTFYALPEAGIWVADGHLCEGAEWWGMNRPRAAEILARAGITAPDRLRFPAGSIWWARPEMLRRIAGLGLGAADFDPERALVDGTTAHALERALGPLAEASGLRLLQGRDLDRLGTGAAFADRS